MFAVLRKEIADHFNSTRFLILYCLVLCVAVLTTYTVGTNIRSELSGGQKFEYLFLMLFTSGRFFSLTWFIAFFGPLIGIIMGFDAINRERNAGTLSKVLSQPVHRDALINGKFLAGMVTVSIVFLSLILLISGLGMVVIGVTPTAEELARLAIYMLISIVYVGFWMGLAILFSILFRSIGTSALAAVALWIFMSFFVAFISYLMTDVLKNERVAGAINHISPVSLYSDATSTIMHPSWRNTTGILTGTFETMVSLSRFSGALPIRESILIVAPYITTLIALTVLCFGVSYLVFMRQEIRAI